MPSVLERIPEQHLLDTLTRIDELLVLLIEKLNRTNQILSSLSLGGGGTLEVQVTLGATLALFSNPKALVQLLSTLGVGAVVEFAPDPTTISPSTFYEYIVSIPNDWALVGVDLEIDVTEDFTIDLLVYRDNDLVLHKKGLDTNTKIELGIINPVMKPSGGTGWNLFTPAYGQFKLRFESNSSVDQTISVYGKLYYIDEHVYSTIISTLSSRLEQEFNITQRTIPDNLVTLTTNTGVV